MEKNAGYEIRESVLFDNGRGFALGENFKAPNPFVTWQFTQEDGKRDYYWGHYFNGECEAIGDYNRRVFSYEKQYGVSHTEEAAAVKDFAARSADYQRRYGVQEVKRPIAEQMKVAKEQTEKPVDKVREMPPKAKSREREER